MALLDCCRAFNQNPIYQPAMRVITAITNASPAQITTMYPHQYQNGLIVRIDVPFADGMQQINQLTGTVTIDLIDPTKFTLNIDTTLFDPFTIPQDPNNPGSPPPQTQICAFAVPVGEDASIVYQATRNVLPYGS
jgi:hypothetical protein